MDSTNIRLSSPDDVIIVIMGMTGAGKSSFIAHCTQDKPPDIGHRLHSCMFRLTYHEKSLTIRKE